MQPQRLFIIDPSAVGRLHLSQDLAAAGFEITGTAADPSFAWPKLQAHWPDVIVLDIEWPRLDAVGFLKRLADERPTPVVLSAAGLARHAPAVQQALSAGATAFAVRRAPTERATATTSAAAATSGDNSLVTAIRQAGRSPAPNPAVAPRPVASSPPVTLVTPPPVCNISAPRQTPGRPTTRVVAIGISTGGVQSIEAVLRDLGPDTPGIVLVQHMPEKFTASFAARLNSQYALEVLEARDGDAVLDGRVLIAPGGKHMSLRRQGNGYVVDVREGPPVNHHRPSVDVLFSSVARCAGRNALGIIMTGMGGDGARGLLEMRESGACTAAQDAATSIVFGMPAEAIRLGAADDVLPLNQIAEWIMSTSHRPARDRPRSVSG